MAAQNPLGLSRIGQIAITVHDLGRATRFYRDVLGMKFMFELWMAFFRDPEGNLLALMSEVAKD